MAGYIGRLSFDDERPSRTRVSDEERRRLHKQQGGRCNYCGRRKAFGDMQLDHKTPVADGGRNTPGNLQMLCVQCNTRKGDLTDGQFRRVYGLTPARQAKGPPERTIPQRYFETIVKERRQRHARQRRREDESGLL